MSDRPATDDTDEGDGLRAREDGDRTVYVDRTTGDRGSKGAFLLAYLDPGREDRYGWFCANCETFDNAMDAMGRVECNVCGNRRKPTSWDAAHE